MPMPTPNFKPIIAIAMTSIVAIVISSPPPPPFLCGVNLHQKNNPLKFVRM